MKKHHEVRRAYNIKMSIKMKEKRKNELIN